MIRIFLSDILWLEADDYYCKLVTQEKEFLITQALPETNGRIIVWQPLSGIHADPSFFHCELVACRRNWRCICVHSAETDPFKQILQRRINSTLAKNMRSTLIAFTLLIACISTVCGQKTVLDSIFNLAIVQNLPPGMFRAQPPCFCPPKKWPRRKTTSRCFAGSRWPWGSWPLLLKTTKAWRMLPKKPCNGALPVRIPISLARTFLQIGIL